MAVSETAAETTFGEGVVVLPPPFDAVTNLCSDDADCGGVG